MPARRVNHNLVKLHRSYSVDELARCLKVHKNTVRGWQRNGLHALDKTRPLLFQGTTVRAFLADRSASRKRPCPPGTLYCFRCRSPRAPARAEVDYIATRSDSGNLRALCECCATVMNRRVLKADIPRIAQGCTVQHSQGPPRLSGQGDPSLNCEFNEEG